MENPSSIPTLILYHCKVYDPASPRFYRHTALATTGERIIALGDDAEILALAKPGTQTINGRGCLLLPGLTDAHSHLSGYAERKLRIDLSNCATLSEALAIIRARVDAAPPESWISGDGWDKNRWGLEGFPDKKLLDALSTRHLLALQSKDWHSLWVNSSALQFCGIDETTEEPAGGQILRYPASHEPLGILQEKACEKVLRAIPPATFEQLQPALKETFAEHHRLGITGIHSMETLTEFARYQALYQRGELGLRIAWYFPVRHLEEGGIGDISLETENHFLKICGIKLFADGALGSQTADMLENYRGLNHSGVEVLTAQELLHKIRLAVERKLSCAVHAIGDRANRKVLHAFGAVQGASQALGLRHRIEHAQLLHPDDIPLFSRFRVAASVQPIHLAADIPLIERYWGARGRHAYAFGSLLKSGARLVFGSDAPIESFDPWKGMYSAVARKYRCSPAEAPYYPEEQIPISEAVAAYTANSAYLAGEESQLGSLVEGKLADFILIDRDIFSEPAEALLQTKVLLTVLDGQIVHQAM